MTGCGLQHTDEGDEWLVFFDISLISNKPLRPPFFVISRSWLLRNRLTESHECKHKAHYANHE